MGRNEQTEKASHVPEQGASVPEKRLPRFFLASKKMRRIAELRGISRILNGRSLSLVMAFDPPQCGPMAAERGVGDSTGPLALWKHVDGVIREIGRLDSLGLVANPASIKGTEGEKILG